MDGSCYMACIFTGLAYLKLGNTASSKQYYKRAIELQPDEKLGWKVSYWRHACVLVPMHVYRFMYYVIYYACNSVFSCQGLADFYDKQKPTVAQEMVDAVTAYQKLLQYLDT